MRIKNICILSCLISVGFIINSCSQRIDRQANIKPQLQQVSAAEKVVKAELGESRDLSPDFMCYNVNSTQVADWQDRDFVAAV
ncbi:MAG: hypothetical protein AAFY63_03655, partial [Cyanobacteria bacterium J06643_13]